MSNSKACSGSKKIIFACSGAADVGALSDRVARELTQEGFGKTYCTAGLGGKVDSILKTANEAEVIVALDGCPLDCVKLSLENLNIAEYEHLRVTDLGLKKGKTEINVNNINKVKGKLKQIIIRR